VFGLVARLHACLWLFMFMFMLWHCLLHEVY